MSDKDQKLSLADRIRKKQEETKAAANDTSNDLMSKFAAAQKDSGDDDVTVKNTVAEDDAPEKSSDEKSAFASAQKQESKTTDVKQLMRQRAEEKAARLSERLEAKRAKIEADDEDDEELEEEELAELQGTVDELRERYTELISKVKLTSIVSETESLGNFIEDMPDGIAQIRSRGYIYHSYLEGKTTVLAEKWDNINDKIEEWLEDEVTELEDELAEAEHYVEAISGDLSSKHKTVADKFGGLLDVLETKVTASEERVEAIYEEVDREVNKTKQLLVTIGKYLDWIDEASFDLEGNEGIYMVAEAEWRDGGDKPDGFLYLTNERLVFEQSEKVGKRLGMFGGKQVRQVLWEAPLDAFEKSESENKGMLGGIDLVHLNFGSGSRYAEITVEVKGGVAAKDWATQIKRAANGSIAQDSTVEPDPEMIERLREAPTDCPTCGATLPTIGVGDTQVQCDYCGTVVRI